MQVKSMLGMAAMALLISAGSAVAQGTAQSPAATPPAAKAPAKNLKKATTPEGIECSAQADAKSLKGKARQAFRRKCIAGLKKANAPAKAAPSKSAPKAN
ncbi:MAG TPA: PsiF family protein [Hyphomicrobiaceae bacterium]|nr:PsiF family protein [Hyphomicrobiaceae bacterium]